MNRVVTAAQMRTLEGRAADRGLPGPVLLEQAGQAVARALRRHFPEPVACLFLIGPGNNGGDGLVAARELALAGYPATAYVWGRHRDPDPELAAAEAARVAIRRSDGDPEWARLDAEAGQAPMIVDALLGIGNSRPIAGPLSSLLDLVERIRRPGQTMVALDLPSGLDADTGTVDPRTLRADLTLTLGAAKWGLIRSPGDAFAGRLEVLDIGIPEDLDDPAWPRLLSAGWVAGRLPRRPRDGHKGTFGRVLVVAGSTSYYGAATLACEAAYRVGAGLVTLATPASLVPVFAAKLTEPTFWPLPEDEAGTLSPTALPELNRALAASDAALIGPGLGQRPQVAAAIESLLPILARWGRPLVFDADALNALAGIDTWWERLGSTAVLTPHPGEFSRLTGRSTAAIAAGREVLALAAAGAWHQTVVLKGAYTVVASPAGDTLISPWANPLLASGGTGDVLAGAIAGLLAQGAPGPDAAAAAVWLHAAAADRLSEEYGDAGLLARELLPVIPRLRRELLARASSIA